MAERCDQRSDGAAADLNPDAVATLLATGAVVLLPTDTLPALAARPEHAARIWTLKQRPSEKPLILMGADLEQLRQYLAVPWHQAWLEQAGHAWPGPVTLVLPIAGATTQLLNPRGHSLGLRVPACDAMRAVLRLSGPLATTSVNRSGDPPAIERHEAIDRFPELPALAGDLWPPASGRASTVLAWSVETDAEPWQTLRQGDRSPPPCSPG